MYLGIDPDLHSLAYCFLTPRDTIDTLGIIRVSDKIIREDAVVAMIEELRKIVVPYCVFSGAVENQEVTYASKQGANPRDLINLAQVAGAAAATFQMSKLYLPKAQAWKGSVPKEIHQARVLRRVGCEVDQKRDHCRPGSLPASGKPRGWDTIRISEWVHVVDAIGLALWAKEQDCGKPVRVRQ